MNTTYTVLLEDQEQNSPVYYHHMAARSVSDALGLALDYAAHHGAPISDVYARVYEGYIHTTYGRRPVYERTLSRSEAIRLADAYHDSLRAPVARAIGTTVEECVRLYRRMTHTGAWDRVHDVARTAPGGWGETRQALLRCDLTEEQLGMALRASLVIYPQRMHPQRRREMAEDLGDAPRRALGAYIEYARRLGR